MAFHRTATQSSTYSNAAGPAVASRAVDGNSDGRYSSVTHTAIELKPWWEVDLGHESKITSISLFNRIDCCQERLANFIVQLSDYAHLPVKTVSQGSNFRIRYDFGFSPGTVARYVRVQLLRQNFLSLAEVEVYGTILGGKYKVVHTISTNFTKLKLVCTLIHPRLCFLCLYLLSILPSFLSASLLV